MVNERRSARRVNFISTAHVHSQAERPLSASLETKNISLKGVFLETSHKLPLGTSCSVDIDLSGTTSMLHFTINGTICRHEADGMAIAFTDLNPDSYAHLQNLIALNQALDQDA